MDAVAKTQRKRILCIADHPNWIFNRHIEQLKRYLRDEFEIFTAYRDDLYDESQFDLIYPLEYMLVKPEQIGDRRKYVTGIRSFISWAELDFLSFTDYLCENFQRVHVVSQELYNIFAPYLPGVAYVTHGVDLDFFTPGAPQSPEPGNLRLGWAGRRDTFIKGYRDYILPLENLQGVDLKICGFVDRNLSLEEMPGFYQSIDAYVCATSYEGSNNSILEAAAMERAIVTTAVGTVPELFRDHESALIIERDPAAFKKAVLELRDNPELRIRLGKNARQSLIEKKWDWKSKAEDYRSFLRSALDASSISDASAAKENPATVRDSLHYLSILQSQFRLLQEMRKGDWVLIYDLNQKIKHLQNDVKALEAEIHAIRSSETYTLVQKMKAGGIGRAFISLYRNLYPKKSD